MEQDIRKDAPAGETLADGVERRLLEYIRLGGLQVGDFLPKEEDLSAALKVSRHIVREAISRLKVLGIVEARKHKGTVMKRPEVFNSLKVAAATNLLTPQEGKQIMEMRIALELGMTEFIFIRKTPEALAKLRELAGKPDATVQNFKNELAFHSALLELSGNTMAGEFREIIYNAFFPVYAKRKQAKPLPAVTHCDICDALENGTLEEFQKIMRIHFKSYFQAAPQND